MMFAMRLAAHAELAPALKWVVANTMFLHLRCGWFPWHRRRTYWLCILFDFAMLVSRLIRSRIWIT